MLVRQAIKGLPLLFFTGRYRNSCRQGLKDYRGKNVRTAEKDR
jgi:hypothetical protein